MSPQAPTTPVAKRSFRPSTIAISAKRATSQHLKLAKRSTGYTKRANTTASSILVPKYTESSVSEEEQEENKLSRGKFKLNGRVSLKAIDFASRKRRIKTSYV